MVSVSGKSLVPVNIQAFQNFLNLLTPPDKLPQLNVKLDGRDKVRSVFAKLEGIDLTIYTGAIVNLGSVKFAEFPEPVAQVVLMAIYGIKKAGQSIDFEIKSTDHGVSNVKADSDFQLLSGNLKAFVAKYNQVNDQLAAQPVVTDVQPVTQHVTQAPPVANVNPGEPIPSPVEEAAHAKAKKLANSVLESPFKDVPLDATPKIDVPADLDLRNV